jgi:hypothetical protein
MLYDCYDSARASAWHTVLLLLYYCFTTALLMLYDCYDSARASAWHTDRSAVYLDRSAVYSKHLKTEVLFIRNI